jgi:ATP-dependent DNA ligase
VRSPADKRANFWYTVAMAKSVRATPSGMTPIRRRVEQASPPTWTKPQLAALVKQAPDGPDWLHEIKFDGYRMHARFDAGRVQILTRRGNDWTDKYPAIAKAIAGLPAQNAYLDGELGGVLPDGRTAFNLIQNASDRGQGSLVFFLFDLLFLDGEDLTTLRVAADPRRRAADRPGAGNGCRGGARRAVPLRRSSTLLVRSRWQRWAPFSGAAARV